MNRQYRKVVTLTIPLWKKNLWIVWLGSFLTAASMSLVLPFLPLFIEDLGVSDPDHVVTWSAVAFGATFLVAAIVSPLWGRLADRKGRKLMLIRASLGMSIVMVLISFVENVYQLVGLRLLMGAVSGFISAGITLVASQTPKEKSGWALGTLSTGGITGGLLGPLIGGLLADWIGLRSVFLFTGSALFLTFIITLIFIKEDFVPVKREELASMRTIFTSLKHPQLIIGLFATTFLIQFSTQSIGPLLTLYVRELNPYASSLAFMAGIVASAPGLAALLSAQRLGRLSDRYGAERILFWALLIYSAFLIPQAFVTSTTQLVFLRFGIGFATAALMPSVQSLLRQNTPSTATGRIFSYNQSAQFMGNLLGPLFGSQIVAHFGFSSLFIVTGLIMVSNAFLERTNVHVLHPNTK
ncbi:multidrug efflux MFS transporter [Exiguobacterium algae]|uniref:multidrug efflux MFS transporter n=1 Tax=Exiguobacterium algae TaxID=2751250 RepID=UPI001F0B6381|nr:multidrug efflux MFS transporter [Exiguobacterium algae]